MNGENKWTAKSQNTSSVYEIKQNINECFSDVFHSMYLWGVNNTTPIDKQRNIRLWQSRHWHEKTSY